MRESKEEFDEYSDGSGYRYLVRIHDHPDFGVIVSIHVDGSSVEIVADKWERVTEAVRRGLAFVADKSQQPPQIEQQTVPATSPSSGGSVNIVDAKSLKFGG